MILSFLLMMQVHAHASVWVHVRGCVWEYMGAHARVHMRWCERACVHVSVQVRVQA
jgi:hypothetical protein